MLEWIARGLRVGIVTTRYPRRPEHAPAGFRGRIEVTQAGEASAALEAVCPVGAIQVRDSRISVARGGCVLCGACVAHDPRQFTFAAEYETAVRRRGSLVAGESSEPSVGELRRTLGDRSRTLKRSIHIRHVDAGSDGGEEWEIAALTNPYYDLQRLGLFFTLSPRHADILLVTGGVTPSMREPLLRAHHTMPEPKAVVAVGTDACSGGFAAAAGEVAGGVDQLLPVDVYVPGSPPAPIAILHGLLLAAGVVTHEAAA
ncbi:MAG: NADH-quinone oxidoreductase subunit B family protein [Solirubrobacteraceae bacterium]